LQKEVARSIGFAGDALLFGPGFDPAADLLLFFRTAGDAADFPEQLPYQTGLQIRQYLGTGRESVASHLELYSAFLPTLHHNDLPVKIWQRILVFLSFFCIYICHYHEYDGIFMVK
jgi:hypothetical protein